MSGVVFAEPAPIKKKGLPQKRKADTNDNGSVIVELSLDRASGLYSLEYAGKRGTNGRFLEVINSFL